MQKLIPHLWFEKDLDKVVEYYSNIFKSNLKVLKIDEKQTSPHGEFQTSSIEIFGQRIDLITAGPVFKFNEAFSWVINCEDQDEVDYYWDAFTTNGGQESMCSWCKDKYGLSWQVIPKKLGELMQDADSEKRNYALRQMLQMKKIIIKDLEK